MIRVRRGSWVIVKGARRWVVVAACGQQTVAGGHSRAVGGRRGCRLCPSMGGGRHLWAVSSLAGGASFLGCGGRFREQK